MVELKFFSAQDYINYDFNNNHGFFIAKLTDYMDSIERIQPGESINIDFEKYFADKIASLFETYNCLIIKLTKKNFMVKSTENNFI